MVMKSTIPDAAESRALMTGIGQDTENIEIQGRARTQRVADGVTPSQAKVACEPFKGIATERAQFDALYSASMANKTNPLMSPQLTTVQRGKLR